MIPLIRIGMKVDRDKTHMVYRIVVEVYHGMRLVNSFTIPSSVIVNTFTEIARLVHDGYRDSSGHIQTTTIKENKKDMR